MQPTRPLRHSQPRVHLRLQAPTLTVGPHHEVASEWCATGGNVSLEMQLTEVADGHWRITGRLTNRGADAVDARIAWPYVFYRFDQTEPARVFDPLYGGTLEPRSAPIVHSYPGPASYCLAAATAHTSAVAVGLFNTEQRHTRIRHCPAGPAGQIRFVIERWRVAGSSSVELPELFIAIGEDWAAAMRPYREWLAQTFPRRHARPRWLVEENCMETRRAHCLAPRHPRSAAPGVWIFEDDGRQRTFADIKAEVDEALEDAAQKGYRPLFYQFGWWANMATLRGLFMFDSLCGDYTAAHDLTRRTIDYIHERGARTYLYTNIISAGDETAVFRDQPELFVRNAAGGLVYNADYPMVLFCPGAPGLREYWEGNLQFILGTLGADGVFLDQACGGTPPPYCDCAAHRHAHPDTYGQDFLALLDWIHTRARTIRPDCYVGGELFHDARALILDEAHGYGYAPPKSKDPLAEYFVFTRYLCPHTYSQPVHRTEGLFNGATGSAADPLWREYRRVFEAGVQPCRVEPAGTALAYLYGKTTGPCVLAVRGTGAAHQVVVHLPDGSRQTVAVTREPVFHVVPNPIIKEKSPCYLTNP